MGMVLRNARIHTLDPTRPVATTIVLRDGLIAYVGESDVDVDVSGLPVHDLAGRTVIPGLVDSHTHPASVARSGWHVRLPWTTDVDVLLDFVREYAQAHPPAEIPFLYFEYYPGVMFPDAPPTKELLDSAVSDRPCLCQDFGEHEHWVNSRMLELMGVTRDTPDPVPGLEMFVRDEHGEATGQLRENVHLHFLDRMFDALGWRPPEDLSVERIRPFLRFLSEHGVTALLDAIVEDEQMLASVAELDRRGELNLFYDAALRFRDRTDLPGVLERLHELQAAYGNDHIRVRTVKLFLDGTNELGNSALLEPRCDHADPPGLGEIALSVDELLECCLLCNEQDVDVHIHLVGDRAFRVACDAVEAAQARLSGSSTPWRIRVTLAHCELVDDADLHRPAQLGIAINWSTHWSGGYFGEGARPILGDERWRRMYRFNELADSGAVVAFSSDVVTAYESHRADPFFGMHVASTRVDPEFPLDPERFPASLRPETSARLPRDVLLRGYSLDGARQLGVEDSMGSLEVGKSANLVVLSADPLDPEVSLLDVDVDVVVFEGDVVVGGW